MKKITLSKILNNLLYLNNEVIIDAEISKRAYSAVDRMIKLDIS
jgi:quinolinate synthase